MDGIRTKKTTQYSTTEYILDGDRVLAEKEGSTVVYYLYDDMGSPIGMIYYGTTYMYEKNLQGDIVALISPAGEKVVTYAYDAWGNLVHLTYTQYSLVFYNSFRYRGYYYNRESGFYYLGSRYYDPTTGRFLNPDGSVNANGDMSGFNMYAYCSNNPVMHSDSKGTSATETIGESAAWWSLIAVLAAVNPLAAGAVLLACGTIGVSSYAAAETRAAAESVDVAVTVEALPEPLAYPEEAAENDEDISEIAEGFNVGECVQAADAIKESLKSKNLHGAIIEIQFTGGKGYIWSESRQMVISINGYHCGVLYNGLVYCNVHPYGLPKEVWISDFWSTGSESIREIYF